MDLIIDFDKRFLNASKSLESLVLADNYINPFIININKTSDNFNDEVFQQFTIFKKNINLSKSTLIECEMFWFSNFFVPLGKWFSAIDKLILDEKIDRNSKITFTSYSKNQNIFLAEAEGESNSQILYKKSYYLSFYIKSYLLKKGITNIVFEKNVSLKSKISFAIRGRLLTSIKAFKLAFSRALLVFFRKRIHTDNKFLFLLRGSVQTEFIEGIYSCYGNKFDLVVNESSFSFKKNYRLAKSKGYNCYRNEGNIKISELIKELCLVSKSYRNKSEEVSIFYGIDIQIKYLLKEVSVLNFNLRTYALSIKNVIIQNKKKYKKIISFEMMKPYAHFITEFTDTTVNQIQTTLIESKKFPNFSYSNMFFFNNKERYINHTNLLTDKTVYGYLDNIKYLGLKKKEKLEDIKSATYFAQPVHQNEENELISYLIELCNQLKVKLSIKIHPRSKETDFLKFHRNFIVSGNNSSQEIISKTDLVFTRNSSIGLDAWFLNTPILFFVDKSLSSKNVTYIPSDYLGKITIQNKVETLKILIPKIIDNFYNHKYHQDLYIDKDEIRKKLFN